MKIKAISFDYWHTLFVEQPGGYKLYQKTRHRLLKEALNEQDEYEFEDDEIREAARLEMKSHDFIWRQEHRTLGAAERLGRMLCHLNARLSDDALRRITHAYEEGILERPPVLIDGVREVLQKVSGRYRLGIISDTGFSPGRVLKQVMKSEGILDAFDSLVFSDEASCSKPHREVFRRTAEALEAEPQQIIHIGDLEHTDIAGAKNANYYAIRFTGITTMDEGETTRADVVTADFSKIPEIIEALAE